jgi:hypothetical protein
VSVTGTLSSSGGYGAVSATTLTVNSNNISADNSLGFRNRIINGDMRIAQRGTAAVTASGDYPVDRFIMGNNTDGAFSAQQDSSAPAGFVNSVKITTTTADGTLTTDQQLNFRQAIEGTNVSDLAWGTANAKTVTLSFWVRSSLTGTFGGSLKNSASDRSYPFTYSISVADTWEYKTVTIPGDTSGTWLTTTGVGVTVFFGLGVGPDRSGTAGAWAGANYSSATGGTSVIGTLNATWYVTGVQFEVGSVATPFERRPFGTELALCQRYLPAINAVSGTAEVFGTGGAASTTVSAIYVPFNTTARVKPTGITVSSVGHFQVESSGAGGALGSCTDLTFGQASVNGSRLVATTTAGTPTLVAGQAVLFRSNSSNNGQILFTGCEL